MGPQLSIYNDTNTELVNSWNIGTLKAQIPSEVLTINIWNNKGGSTTVSDLKEAYLMVLDNTGDTALMDIPRDKWVQANVPNIDGNTITWTPIGGTAGKDLKGNSISLENAISGKSNDGVAANSPENVCTVNLRVVAPPNADPGDKFFKIRITGYFT